MKNQKGVSIVTLVITIIVLIILLLIGYRMTQDPADKAIFMRFSQEITDIKKGVETQKLINSKDGLDEATLNRNFKKIIVKNPPENFVSFDTDELTAYLIDLKVIDYQKIKTGQGYKNIKSGDTVTFDVDDVYVFDKLGTVYYLKGLYIENEGIYYTNIEKKADGPVVEAENTEGLKVQVKVYPANGGEISSVTVGGELATKVAEGVYEIEVPKNGTYIVIATEEDVGSTRTVVKVTKGDEEGTDEPEIAPPTKGIVTINNGEPYTKNVRAIVNIDTDANQMSLKHVTSGVIPTQPNSLDPSWRTVAETYPINLSEGTNDVYVWFRNKGNNTTILEGTATILLDTVPPTTQAPTVEIFDEQSFRITANQKDFGSGIKKIEIGYREESEVSFKWITVSDIENPTIEISNNTPGKNYIIKTKAEDNVGNQSESKEAQTGVLSEIPSGVNIYYSPKDGWTKVSHITIEYPARAMEGIYEKWYRINGGEWRTASRQKEEFDIEENATIEAVVVKKVASQTLFGEIAKETITNIDNIPPEFGDVEILD